MSAVRKITEHQEPTQRSGGFTCEFEQINSPGCYLNHETGSLFRIPQDALIPGRSPAIEVISARNWFVTKLSDDPYLPVTKARMIAADMDLRVEF